MHHWMTPPPLVLAILRFAIVGLFIIISNQLIDLSSLSH
jgi:hypothetical protein